MNKAIQVGTRMRLHCLGHLRLDDMAGTELTPRTRKARALLAYLAIAGRPVSRERLADLLWSARGPDQAKSSLRQALFELRHLANSEAAVTSPASDEVSVNAQSVATDLSAIRRAAEADDLALLESLLAAAAPGLLADLDGLDPEFDDWLRTERAREPAQTFGIALAAARRALDKGEAEAAQPVVAELQRLDPCGEAIARTAMNIAHASGDRGALHRHYALLRDRLNSDLAATPSPETRQLFARLSGSASSELQDAPLQSEPAYAEPDKKPIGPPVRDRWPVLAAIALTLVAAIAVFVWLMRPEEASSVQPLVAVLPFDQQEGTSQALAEGLWDDTRLALSQNRTVRVLGRTTSLALSGQPPEQLRKRLGVDYLLEGGVRTQGEQVRIVVSLTRAADGVSVWEKSFEGRLGDALALQGAVAQGIEGRIRGRLSPGGGVVASQISTTPQTYKLYSEARALIRERGWREIQAAELKLRRAVELDPNYAPAWASLASTARINRLNPGGSAKTLAEGAANARRAIDLAPNLAQGYAALALVEGEQLESSQRYLKRAVALDPGNAEAWNWLGNSYSKLGRRDDARAAYERALAVDPYFLSPLSNLIEGDIHRGREAEARQHVDQLVKMGASRRQTDFARAMVFNATGDYSEAVKVMSARYEEDGPWQSSYRGLLGDTLVSLGYTEFGSRVWGAEPWFTAVVLGKAVPPDRIRGENVGARDFWLTSNFSTFASRALLRQGKADLLIEKYRKGFRSLDDFIGTLESVDTLTNAPVNLAVALRMNGSSGEADAMLAGIEKRLLAKLRLDPNDRGLMWELSRLKLQRGDRDAALKLLAEANRRRWLPDGSRDPIDIADDPAMQPLLRDPQFQAVRRRILAHIDRERRELGPIRF